MSTSLSSNRNSKDREKLLNLQISPMFESEVEESVQNIEVINKSLVDTNVHLIGDMTTISQIVQLLAYIRHAVKNNSQQDILVKIGRNVVNTPLAMDVNGQEVKDFIAQDFIDIN